MFVKNSSVTIETKDFAMLLAMLPSCGWKTINAIRTRNKNDAEDMEKAIKDIEEGGNK